MKYDVLILDLDGTLYHQFPVRACMFLKLAVYYAFRPHRIRELLVLKNYRKLRECKFGDGHEDFDALQVHEAANLSGVSDNLAREVIASWMTYKPLTLINMFKRKRLLGYVRELQNAGTIIIVYSDYPVREKLSALGLKPDYSYCSTDTIISCMKPDSSGLRRVLSLPEIAGKGVLYVGDRDDRDGECARNCGVEYMDVSEFESLAK